MQVENENVPAANAGGADDSAAAGATPPGPIEGEGGQGQGDAGNGGSKPNEGDAGTPKGDEGKPKEGDGKPAGAPEQYEAFKLPEGYTLEGDRLEMAHEFAKANNWTQEQAQEGMNTYIKLREHERAYERGAWAVRSEEEFGKNFESVVESSKRVRGALESERPTIGRELEETNLGNHPMVLFLFNKIAELTKERPQEGLGNEASQHQRAESRAERLYDKTPQ